MDIAGTSRRLYQLTIELSIILCVASRADAQASQLDPGFANKVFLPI
jgi:hypothetical protein